MDKIANEAERDTEELHGKFLVSFHPDFKQVMDEHWKAAKFKTRTEYLAYVVRLDIERSGRG